MGNDKDIKGVLDVIFEQEEAYKFVLGLAVIFILPPIVNIVNTWIRNKNLNSFMRATNHELSVLSLDLNLIKEKINLMFNENVEESSLVQMEAVFRGRVSIDIELMIRNTKNVIVINHIENKEVTRSKVVTFCNTVYSNTSLTLDNFKRDGVKGSNFTDKGWTAIVTEIIYDFIYSVDDSKAYNYDTLKYQLKGQFDTFTVDFINKVNGGQ